MKTRDVTKCLLSNTPRVPLLPLALSFFHFCIQCIWLLCQVSELVFQKSPIDVRTISPVANVLRVSRQCWCGKSEIVYDRHGQGNCDYPCTGDMFTSCGGLNALSLYDFKRGSQSSPSPTPPAPTPSSVPASDAYLGCYADRKADRVLSYKTKSDEMTPQASQFPVRVLDRRRRLYLLGECFGIELS